MKAIVYTEFGPPDVLRLQEVEKPVPRDDEVLIRVQASTVSTGDVNARGFAFVPPGLGPLARLMLGPRRPKKTILGIELAGVIETVGRDVTLFKPGDHVFGIDGDGWGAYAEFKTMPEDGALLTKPVNLTPMEAAAIPFGALTALLFLRDLGGIQRGAAVLVNGASGSVGSAAVQLAKHFGAEVTGVCSTRNVDLVRSLGADRVIDYTQEDVSQSEETYDIILNTVLGQPSFSAFRRSLQPDGRYLAVAGGLKEMGQMLWTRVFGGPKVVFGGGQSSERKELLLYLKELVEAGQLRPVIDRTFPLAQIVEAHRYVDTGRKQGNVVIIVSDD